MFQECLKSMSRVSQPTEILREQKRVPVFPGADKFGFFIPDTCKGEKQQQQQQKENQN